MIVEFDGNSRLPVPLGADTRGAVPVSTVEFGAGTGLPDVIGAVTKGAVPARERVEFTASVETPVPIAAVPRGAVPLLVAEGLPVRSFTELLNSFSVFDVLG